MSNINMDDNEKAYQVVYNPSSKSVIGFSSQSLDKNQEEEFNKQYQYNQKRFVQAQQEKSTFKQAAMTMMKGYVGSGLLALPYAFSQGGWILSVAIFLVTCLTLLISIRALLEVGIESKIEYVGISELSNHLYGPRGVFVTRLFLIAYQIGKGTAYLIFFIQFFSYVMSDAEDESEAGNWIYLIFALCIVIPMGFIDNMALFTKFSIVANILTWISLIAVVGFQLDNMINGGHFKENFSDVANFDKFPMVIGVSVFSMGVTPILFPIKNSMLKQEEFSYVLFRIYSQLFEKLTRITIAIYLVFCVFSVWAYGTSTNQIILFSLQDSPVASVIQVFYAFALIQTYPLQLLPAFQQIEKFHTLKNYINPELKYSRFRRLLIRSVLNITMGFIAYGIPQFAYFINILGSIGGALICYVLPMAFHYKMFKNNQEFALRPSTYILVVAFGVIGGGCAFVYTLVKLID